MTITSQYSMRIVDVPSDLLRCHYGAMNITATTVAVLAVVVAAAGAAVGTVSSLEAASAQEKAQKYNAAVARNQAQSAQQQAQMEANRIRQHNRLIAGKQRSAILKSGVDISGSAVDVMYDSAIQGEWDALIALYTGKMQSDNLEASARLSQFQGSTARQMGYYNAGNSILTGAGGIASAGGSYMAATRGSNSGVSID
jgi:hypothetical protein